MLRTTLLNGQALDEIKKLACHCITIILLLITKTTQAACKSHWGIRAYLQSCFRLSMGNTLLCTFVRSTGLLAFL